MLNHLIVEQLLSQHYSIRPLFRLAHPISLSFFQDFLIICLILQIIIHFSFLIILIALSIYLILYQLIIFNLHLFTTFNYHFQSFANHLLKYQYNDPSQLISLLVTLFCLRHPINRFIIYQIIFICLLMCSPNHILYHLTLIFHLSNHSFNQSIHLIAQDVKFNFLNLITNHHFHELINYFVFVIHLLYFLDFGCLAMFLLNHFKLLTNLPLLLINLPKLFINHLMLSIDHFQIAAIHY